MFGNFVIIFYQESRNTMGFAALAGDLTELKQCIADGRSIDELSDYGLTPLLYATTEQRLPAVMFLLAHKANVNKARPKDGITPLIDAAKTGRYDICQVLLKAGADKSMQCEGKTAAQVAAGRGHKELADFIESWQVCLELVLFSIPFRRNHMKTVSCGCKKATFILLRLKAMSRNSSSA